MYQDDRNKAREDYARDVHPGSGERYVDIEKRKLEFHRRIMEANAARESNARVVNTGNPSSFYIRKDGADFKHEGVLLSMMSRDTDYYCCFDALYSSLSDGGFIPYDKLGDEVKKRIPKARRMQKNELVKFIQRNLTDEHNGFLYRTKILNSVAGGKKLIRAVRGKGVEFNNRKGG